MDMRPPPISLVRPPPNPNDAAEKQANSDFAQTVLSNFGQILTLSVATHVSVHRARLAKLRELSDSPSRSTADS
jgi:hypothetical protein